MRQQSVGCEKNSCYGILLIIVKRNVLIHIRKFEKFTFKHSFLYVSEFIAISILKALSSLFIRPYPILKFGSKLFLLFNRFDGFVIVYKAVDYRFARCIKCSGIHTIGNLNCLLVKCIFKQVKHWHSLCAKRRKNDLLIFAAMFAFIETTFLRDLPNSRKFIVKNLILLFFPYLCFRIKRVQSNKMQNKIINYIGRNPR